MEVTRFNDECPACGKTLTFEEIETSECTTCAEAPKTICSACGSGVDVVDDFGRCEDCYLICDRCANHCDSMDELCRCDNCTVVCDNCHYAVMSVDERGHCEDCSIHCGVCDCAVESVNDDGLCESCTEKGEATAGIPLAKGESHDEDDYLLWAECPKGDWSDEELKRRANDVAELLHSHAPLGFFVELLKAMRARDV